MAKLSSAARQALAEERKRQILTAAVKIFAAKGYERATIADIAKEAGMAEGSIYNYFKNKGDLLISLPRQVIQPPVQALAAFAQGNPPQVTLTLMGQAMVQTMRENGHLFRIFLSAMPRMSKKAREQYYDQVIMYAGHVFEAYFADLIRQGVFRADARPDILALSFIGMFFPTLFIKEVLELKAPFADDDQVVAECVRVFLRGALASPTDSQPVLPRGAIPVE